MHFSKSEHAVDGIDCDLPHPLSKPKTGGIYILFQCIVKQDTLVISAGF